MHYLKVHVQGFELERLLNSCIIKKIPVWNVKILNEMEMIIKIEASDWDKLNKLSGNKYKTTILTEKGLKPLRNRFFSKKSTLVGIVIFALLLYYQSCFVSEVRIHGYQKLTEKEIREQLTSAGLYEGCSKKIDLDQVEVKMYRQLENISWIGIEYKGNLAEVTVVEGAEPIEVVDLEQPCHIVAAKEGYIDKVIAREGMENVIKGEFVESGDILISGILSADDEGATLDAERPIERYTRANGEVYAKTVYRFTYYQDKEESKIEKTGRMFPGLFLSIGGFKFNSADLFWPYDVTIYKENILFNSIRPVPIKIGVNHQYEIEIEKKKRGQESIEKKAKQQTREAIKENIPDSAQILNKSLKFCREENIIKVTIMIEALEEIGKTQGFVPAKNDPIEKLEEGLISFGKRTN